jgi:septum formation protein
LILASTSPYRRALLARLNVPFEAIAPAIDEDSLKDESLGPQAMAEMLALAKARSLQSQYPQAVIIGSDQTCACDGRILHKPGHRAGACEQLAQLAGKTHELITAVVVQHAETSHRYTDITRLTMRTLSRSEIERYVDADQPYDCVGAYKLEQHGIALFETIDSRDHTAIIGLPLMAVAKILRMCGIAVP